MKRNDKQITMVESRTPENHHSSELPIPGSELRVPHSEAVQSSRTAVVIGASAGGTAAVGRLLASLPPDFPCSVIVIQHLHASAGGYLVDILSKNCVLPVRDVEEKTPTIPGYVYVAAANYHLMIEKDETFSLTIDAKVNHARPSIDVCFDCAARVWGPHLIGILLTGANHDGARGLGVIKAHGGLTIAQDPATAECPVMPRAAIEAGAADRVMSLEEIAEFLGNLQVRNTEGEE